MRENVFYTTKRECRKRRKSMKRVNVENNINCIAFQKNGSPQHNLRSSLVFVPRVRWVCSLRALAENLIVGYYFTFLARRKSTWRSEEISYISNMLWERTGAKTCYKKTRSLHKNVVLFHILVEIYVEKFLKTKKKEIFVNIVGTFLRSICF